MGLFRADPTVPFHPTQQLTSLTFILLIYVHAWDM